MEEIENVQVDFTGQTVLEKIDEGVQYFTNAIRNEEEESIGEFTVFNSSLSLTNLIFRTLNSPIDSNKHKLEEIRILRNKIGEYA